MKLLKKIAAPSFEKTASRNNLSDNPATYPSELLALLYKQHAFLGQYQVNLQVKGQDDSLGYMYGVFLVSPISEVPPDTSQQTGVYNPPEAQPAQPDPSQVMRIPVIVAEKKAYSFDVFINPEGKFMPLNERRISASLFDASPYVAAPPSAAMGSSTAAGGANFDPAVPSSGYGGRSTPNAQITKVGSVFEGLNITEAAAEELVDQIKNEPALRNAIWQNPAFKESLTKLASAAACNDERTKIASARNDHEHNLLQAAADSDSVVLVKSPGGYRYTTGSKDTGITSFADLPNHQAESLPVDVRQAIHNDGFAVVTKEKNAGLSPVSTPDMIEEVTSSGVYSVLSASGKAERAAIISNPVSLASGEPTDYNIIVAKSGTAVQEKVAGIRCGDLDLAALSGQVPKGTGVFVFGDTVTEVVKVAHVIMDNEFKPMYLVDDPFHGRVKLSSANVQKLVHAGGNELLLPADHKFLPVEISSQKYSHEPDRMVKISSRVAFMNEVTLTEDADERLRFSYAGHDGEQSWTDPQAALILSLMGDTDAGAKEKIAQAHHRAVKFVAAHRPARLLAIDDSYGEAATGKKKLASGVDPKFVAAVAKVININLVKEAASLNSTDTVDSVLSLNFVTPENVRNYIDAVPVLEESVQKLAELLIGVRLGVTDVPEAAVSSALSGIERALTGLKKLQLRAGAEAT